MCDKDHAKQQGEKSAYDNSLNQTQAVAGTLGYSPAPDGYRTPTMAEEKEKSASYHFQQSKKEMQAANFFRSHPEFEEFIRLIRSGAVQI